ncbi:MAG: nif-specific transcriptional activator NifA [Candidatus Omnitrophota bacterium]
MKNSKAGSADEPTYGPAKHEAKLERELVELATLYEIAKAVNASLELESNMRQILTILHEKMGMERGTLCLLDDETNELAIEVAHGLDTKAIQRGRYRVGEGITGKVVATGEPIVVPNIGDEPLFLNRTRSRDIARRNVSFICVPIKVDQKTVGVLSADRLFRENVSFEEDVRLLTLISSLVAQAVRLHRLRKRERQKLEQQNTIFQQELQKKFRPSNILGESKRMADVYASIQLVSQTPATVLLRGASGTGKELVAHAIHYASDRAGKPFIKVSCAALPDTLLESELFGYEKGAFTGAVASKMGRFELANGGTLFLDEIGDIPMSTQVKLLRVLQEKEFERVGGTGTIRVNLRLITATNKNLEEEVAAKRFREDLYYRLNVVPIFLPALRERKEDIPLLVNHFLKKANEENGKKVRYISDAAMESLVNYSWPGNVRELENAMARAVVLSTSDTLETEHFPIPEVKTVLGGGEALSSAETRNAPGAPPASLTGAVEALEKRMVEEALRKAGGNQRKAAKMLAVTERILGYKIKRYGLKSDSENKT